MDVLYEEAKSAGALFVFGNEVVQIRREPGGYVLRTQAGEEIFAEIVINTAGLWSDRIAELAGFDIARCGYKLHYCKGDYFALSGPPHRIRHLVYPVPHEKGYGLGVHATINLAGHVRFGPDTTYVDSLQYDVSSSKLGEFCEAAKKYFPWMTENQLRPDMAGMRPKLQGSSDGFRDFVIQEESALGFPGFINLIGIESPGLTSALAIGDYVLENFILTINDNQ
jgi:L-2-hydroxyglutarate oxidase LhgO